MDCSIFDIEQNDYQNTMVSCIMYNCDLCISKTSVVVLVVYISLKSILKIKVLCNHKECLRGKLNAVI